MQKYYRMQIEWIHFFVLASLEFAYINEQKKMFC